MGGTCQKRALSPSATVPGGRMEASTDGSPSRAAYQGEYVPSVTRKEARTPGRDAATADGQGAMQGSALHGSTSMISAGEELIRKLKDPHTDPEELERICSQAVVEKKFEGMLLAKDERGRTPLHVAATRGDSRLCKRMMQMCPEALEVKDGNGETPIMGAAFTGRSIIVRDMCRAGADVTVKNNDLMNSLQLACNEGAGNGDVVEELIKAGADPEHKCWDVTPLMAAADSGHIWAIETLIALGSDPWHINNGQMAALDYCRDMESAQFLYDVMQQNQLLTKPAPKIDTGRLFKDTEERRERLFRAKKEVTLQDAFAVLELDREWLAPFQEHGQNYNEIRKIWRRLVLKFHPDKQPEDLPEEKEAEWTAKFHAVSAAFDAVDRHYRSLGVTESDDQPDPN